jgi:DNA polymerase III epsilon subunit family exonuclease
MAGKNAPALLAHYYETLSMDRAKQFVESMREASECDELEGMEDDTAVGYKVLKIFASERQMLQLMMQMDMMGLDVEEIEDGMPKAMAELTVPDFDSFVAFDIEHTGTFGAAHGDAEAEIIEIGAVKVVNGVVVDKFDELCNPGRKIVPRIARLTHITDSMVADKPSVDEVIKQFKAFVGDSVLIGHNIKGCDIPHITRAARRAGVQFDNSYLDTKILAKKHKESHGWKNIKLTTLSEYFCITQTEAHRAWCDAEANAYVYLKLKQL